MKKNIYKSLLCAVLVCSICKSSSIFDDPTKFYRIPDEQFLTLSRVLSNAPKSENAVQSFFPQQNMPSKSEIDDFIGKISEMKENGLGDITLVIADQGSDRFLNQFNNVIFVDPLMRGLAYKGKKSDEEIGQKYKNALFVKSTLSDFLYFVEKNENLFDVLKESAKLIFDDWSIITNEQSASSYGNLAVPVHLLEVPKKLAIIQSLLAQNGKIVTSCLSLTNGFFDNFIFVFDFKILEDNVRRQPQLLDSSAKNQNDSWILQPKDAFLSVWNQKKIGNSGKEEMEYWGMNDEDYARLDKLFTASFDPKYRTFDHRMVEFSFKPWISSDDDPSSANEK